MVYLWATISWILSKSLGQHIKIQFPCRSPFCRPVQLAHALLWRERWFIGVISVPRRLEGGTAESWGQPVLSNEFQVSLRYRVRLCLYFGGVFVLCHSIWLYPPFHFSPYSPSVDISCTFNRGVPQAWVFRGSYDRVYQYNLLFSGFPENRDLTSFHSSLISNYLSLYDAGRQWCSLSQLVIIQTLKLVLLWYNHLIFHYELKYCLKENSPGEG